MLQTVSKKCGCGAALPLTTQVGDTCPRCGAKLIFERNTVVETPHAVGSSVGRASDTNWGMIGLVGVLLGAVLFFALPPIIYSAADVYLSASLNGSTYLGMAAIITSVILCVRGALALRDHSFEWNNPKMVIPFFSGIIWFLIIGFFIFLIVREALGLDGRDVIRGITDIGWVSFLIVGPLSAVLGGIIAIPVVIIFRKYR